MELKLEGSEKSLKKFLKANSLFMKRNSINEISEEKEEVKEPRKRRTKAEVEADKKDK